MYPLQRLPKRLGAALVAHRAAGEVLHEAMDDEAFGCAVVAFGPRDQRIVGEARAGFESIISGRFAGNRSVEQLLGNRVRREQREPVEQPAALRAKGARPR